MQLFSGRSLGAQQRATGGSCVTSAPLASLTYKFHQVQGEVYSRFDQFLRVITSAVIYSEVEISRPFPVTSDEGGMNGTLTGQLYHATSRDKVTDTLWRQ